MTIKSCLKPLVYLVLPLVMLSAVYKVYATNSDTVTATVTAQVISVVLSGSEPIPFGVVATSSTQDTTALGLGTSPDYSITATNDGSVTEDFHIQASNSTDGAVVWTLADTAGSENYTMKYCTTNCDSSPSWNSVGRENNSSYVKFADDIVKEGSQVFDLQIGTPTSTASVDEQSTTVTVLATTVDGSP